VRLEDAISINHVRLIPKVWRAWLILLINFQFFKFPDKKKQNAGGVCLPIQKTKKASEFSEAF